MGILDAMNKAALSLPTKKVKVKQWGRTVVVCRINIIERKNMFAMFEDKEKDVAPLLVAFSLVDDDGTKLHEKEGINAIYDSLVKGDDDVLSLLFEACEKLSLVTAKSVDDIKKK